MQVDPTLWFVPALFVVLTVFTMIWFVNAGGASPTVYIILLIWLGIQGFLSSWRIDFYSHFESVPPRFPLLIVPPLLMICFVFATRKGRSFMDGFNIRKLTLLHSIRIPVELTLLYLFHQKLVPQLMTFEGRNFDILSGISAPLIWYFGFRKGSVKTTLVLVWNFICLGLLLNIVINAILSAPGPLQHFAFDQPNIGVFKYPYSWLPSVIVPIVLFSHLISIRQLVRMRKISWDVI